MKPKRFRPSGPVAASQPNEDATLDDWVAWYWSKFFPAWVERTCDPEEFGFFELLDIEGKPQKSRKSVLVHARLLFTFSHLALISGNDAHLVAAKTAAKALARFRKPSGLYCRGLTRDGQASEDHQDRLAASYDQSFVILGLSTWAKLAQSDEALAEIESCWAAIESQLIDPATGLVLEHDDLPEPAALSAPPRAQNPHMHLYEAALQAFEMTGKSIWLDRASTMRSKGLEYFFDDETGTITEFISPDLNVLPGRAGQRREVGHQCEWAWLLMREADLGGDPDMRKLAERLLAFADNHGFAQDGMMQGAAFDAVSSDTSWREDRLLLWPQTEAIKVYAVRANHGEKARALALVMFRRYFAGHAVFVNQLDPSGGVLWSDALSRVQYHTVLALTEGARAGLWMNNS
ncbi:MAG: AGE family epimerase/isomerase [Octadecabacter sp.]